MGTRRYKLVWKKEKQYRDFNSITIAIILWTIANPDYLLDTKKELVLRTR